MHMYLHPHTYALTTLKKKRDANKIKKATE